MPSRSAGTSIRRVLLPFVRFAAHLVTPESAWERVPMAVPEGAFGPGSHEPFASYFEGTSSIAVQSIDHIVAWLQSCEYVSDLEQFHERDLWQHPTAFEARRRGDCEDFALWAWRKLAELGVDAEFCVGRVICDERPGVNRQHAWVIYRIAGTTYLFEPAARTPSTTIRPLIEAMNDYVPYFAVNHRFETSAFAGCALDLHRTEATRGDVPANAD